MARGAIDTPFDVGVRAINGLLTLGRGQRMGLIAVAIVAVLNTVGGNLLTTFTAISNALL